jgi:Fe-S oxidoreductase
MLDTHAAEFWDARKVDSELRRVYDICAGCRRCVGLCPSFKVMFDRIDADAVDGDVEKLPAADVKEVVDLCYQCKLCYNHCPYTPPHRWQVDFPRLMLRARAAETRRHGLSFRDRLLGNTELIGKLGRLGAPLSNWANELAVHRAFLQAIAGIHRDRNLPRFHRETFTRWLRRRSSSTGGLRASTPARSARGPVGDADAAPGARPGPAPAREIDPSGVRIASTKVSAETGGGAAADVIHTGPPAGTGATAAALGRPPGRVPAAELGQPDSVAGVRPARGPADTGDGVGAAPGRGPAAVKVALFYTCTVEYHEPAIGKAAVRVLERNGIDVMIPTQRCCGMPYLDGGAMDEAKALIRENVASLAAAVRDGREIVALGPTCGYMIKQEFPWLDDSEDAKLVAAHTRDLFEFLARLHAAGRLDTTFPARPGPIAYHIPCHLRAQNIGAKSADVLRAIPGATVSVIEKCSAVDGTWGFKREYYELSLKVAKPLFDAIGAAGAARTATDCPLAALQITQGTGVGPSHPIQILAEAYGLDPD